MSQFIGRTVRLQLKNSTTITGKVDNVINQQLQLKDGELYYAPSYFV